MSREEEEQFEQDVQMYSQSLEESQGLSLKDHLEKLEKIVKGMLGDLETSKLDIIQVKKNFIEFDSNYHINNSNFGGMIEKKMGLLAVDFERLIRESRSDLSFLRSQIEQSMQEADSLEELTLQLEEKIEKDENFIGFKYLVHDDDQIHDNLQ